MAALELYCIEPNMLQTPNMMVVEIVKCIVAWKIQFSDLVKDAKSIAGVSPCRQFRAGLNDVT